MNRKNKIEFFEILSTFIVFLAALSSVIVYAKQIAEWKTTRSFIGGVKGLYYYFYDSLLSVSIFEIFILITALFSVLLFFVMRKSAKSRLLQINFYLYWLLLVFTFFVFKIDRSTGRSKEIVVMVENLQVKGPRENVTDAERLFIDKLRDEIKRQRHLNHFIKIVEYSEEAKKDLTVRGDVESGPNKASTIRATIEIESGNGGVCLPVPILGLEKIKTPTDREFTVPPQPFEQPRRLSALLMGCRLFKQRKPDEAVKYLTSAFSSGDSLIGVNAKTEARRFMSRLFIASGDAPHAEQLLIDAIALDSTCAPVYYSMGALKFQKKDWTNSQTAFEEAARLDTTDYRPDYMAGLAAYMRGDHQTARRHFEDVLRRIGEPGTHDEKLLAQFLPKYIEMVAAKSDLP